MNYSGTNVNQELYFKIRIVKKDSTVPETPVYSELVITDSNSSSLTSYDANSTVALNQYYYSSESPKTATKNNDNVQTYKKGDIIFFLAEYAPTTTTGYKLPTSMYSRLSGCYYNRIIKCFCYYSYSCWFY